MPYTVQARHKAKAHVARIRARTRCTNCGLKPVEWHSRRHEKRPNLRVAHLAALGFPVRVINAEIARCKAVCRSCHMKLDGRAAALQRNKPRQPGTRQRRKRCTRCDELAKPLRRGLCNRCNHRHRSAERA